MGTSGEDQVGEEEGHQAGVRRRVVEAVRASIMCPTTSEGAEEYRIGLGVGEDCNPKYIKMPSVGYVYAWLIKKNFVLSSVQ